VLKKALAAQNSSQVRARCRIAAERGRSGVLLSTRLLGIDESAGPVR
jgi:hypothetical protein